MKDDTVTIGLFGTCGSSTWRTDFIKRYEQLGIAFFNPQLPEGTWTPGCVAEENTHLATDAVILFPVTNETTGQGSLAEIGFSINAALLRNADRYFIFYIADDCVDPKASENAIADSVRSRKLVKSKLKEAAKSNDGIFLVDDMESMLFISVELHAHVQKYNTIKRVVNG